MSKEREPKTPWVLGLAGLIPFIGLTGAAQFAPSPFNLAAVTGFYVYTAVILSFLGGARWGFELNARSDYPLVPVLIASNIPPLLAWFGVMLQLTQPLIGLGLLTGGMIASWLWDVQSSGAGNRRLPVWYPQLRTVLTLTVLVCCGLIYWITAR